MPHSAGFRTPAEQWKTSFAKTMELWSRPERIAALEAGLDRLAAVGSTPGTVPVLAVLWPTSFELRRPEGPWGRPRAFLREELAARGIPYVDLFDGFAAAGSPERLYLPDDPMHFGPEGHRLAARLLAAELADRPAADHLAREAPR
jgi:lysophospholipase L1-like esterase